MKKRHKYVSPTLDLIAKKIFSLPDVTAKFIREVLDLPVESVEILEGDQIHEQGFLGDLPFETSVDVRERLDSGLEVIINWIVKISGVCFSWMLILYRFIRL